MSNYCSNCKLFEGGLPKNDKQSGCKHILWDETKVRSNFTIDESVFLWLKHQSKSTGKSMSSLVTLALIDMKINEIINRINSQNKGE